MKLRELLKDIDYTLLKGSLDIDVLDIKYDSRGVNPNDLFIALSGFLVDGHDFIPEAILKGAKVIVVSKFDKIYGDATIIKVDDTRHTLALLSHNFFRHPTDKLTIIGVTGTTGKTTTTHMIKNILASSNIPWAMVGTIGAFYQDKVIKTENTTPESYELLSIFNELVNNGITHVVMEVSSQAYKMHRIDGIKFDIGVLTNISWDHIGPREHESFKDYVSCKNKLFLNSKKVIVNSDAKYLDLVLKDVKAPILKYGINNEADLNACDINLINDGEFIGSSFKTKGVIENEFKISIPGLFNIYNSLSSILVSNLLNIDVKYVKEALLKTKVKGRMETVLNTLEFKVIIDYAHTIDGMQNLMATIKEYKPKRLVSIFGGGGNRDKKRRLSLGQIIGGASDFSIITMDNPRFEEISVINNDIKLGLNKVNAKYIEIDDRQEAIEYAILNHQVGDVILLIGKGHENYQDIKGTKYPFDEHEIIDRLSKKYNMY